MTDAQTSATLAWIQHYEGVLVLGFSLMLFLLGLGMALLLSWYGNRH